MASVLEFVEASCSEGVMASLYECPWTCQAVLRSLSPLGKQILFRLFALEQRKGGGDIVVEKAKIRSWLRNGTSELLQSTLKRLVRLRILQPDHERGNHGSSGSMKRIKHFRVHGRFCSQIRAVLVGEAATTRPWRERKKDYSKALMDGDSIDEFAYECWSVILHFLVGSKEKRRPESSIVKLLKSMDLMRNMGEGLEITNLGYEFMLRDIHEQIWTFMRYYTEASEQPEDILQMIFRMSFCKPGDPCEISQLKPLQQRLLNDFIKFGLVYRESHDSDLFYPSTLGVNIVFGESQEQRNTAASTVLVKQALHQNPLDLDLKSTQPTPTTIEKKKKNSTGMFVIVETNFKVYVYTQNPLHVYMLELFVEIECILPNLVVGLITRASMRSAFRRGITSSQILHFMTENAHPLCRKRIRILPDNVSDQIILWENERNRIVPTKGVLYHHFDNPQQFALVEEYAREQGYHVWSSSSSMKLFVYESAHEDMKLFFASLR